MKYFSLLEDKAHGLYTYDNIFTVILRSQLVNFQFYSFNYMRIEVYLDGCSDDFPNGQLMKPELTD